eukprot:5609733-Amphidinium_carterae.1
MRIQKACLKFLWALVMLHAKIAGALEMARLEHRATASSAHRQQRCETTTVDVFAWHPLECKSTDAKASPDT